MLFIRKHWKLEHNPQSGYVQQGQTLENPNISAQYIERKMKTLPELKVRQNLKGEFVDTGQEFISEDLINRAIAMSSGLAKPRQGREYVSGWDLARKYTYTVGVTLDVTERPYQMVAFERFKDREWEDVFAVIRKRKKIYGGQTVIDATGLGDVVLANLADIKPEGFNFGLGGGKAKLDLLSNLEIFHARGEIAYPYLEMEEADGGRWSNLNEFREATWDTKIDGDFIMALGLALWPMRSSDDFSRGNRLDPKLSKA